VLQQRALDLVRQRRLPDFGFWWNNRGLLWRELVPARTGAWHLVHADPPIAYVMPFGEEVEILARRLSHRDSWLLVSNPWIPRGAAEAHALAATDAARRARYPRVSVIYLCNDAEEQRQLTAAGLDAVFCNQNAFLDDRLFRVMPEVARTHDAIYIAQLISYKRHALARQVESLIVKTYRSGWCRDSAYIDDARAALAHAEWVEAGSDADVSALVNRCRVGLCLSAAEGGMYASTEYLLCGLPVVTTPSVGGRDVFFHDDYVVTVEPDARAVRDGVAALIARRLDPEAIRRRTLQALAVHRATFVDLINRILTGAGRRADFAWGDRFTHKMFRSQDYSLVSREIGPR
jgi:glycosyltransferase involved in cell wall biosynthesis